MKLLRSGLLVAAAVVGLAVEGTHGEPERLGGLEVGHIVVNGLTEQAPDVL